MKNNMFSKKISRFSQKLMLTALASTVIATPALYANTNVFAVTATSDVTSSVAITSSEGFLESVAITWNPVANAKGYNVYYKSASASDSSYKQLDTELIRQYSSYMRADVLGLPEGNYIVKVVPIINGQEDTSKQAITSTINVTAHTREGFAFSPNSPMGTGSGGYNDDGSVPANANIIYISADTVNTVQLDVVTNSKGATTTCTGLTDILAKRQKGYDKSPLIIRMIGTIDASDISGLNSSGYIQIKGSYNTTLEGVGEDATARGWGILVRDAHNVEIRNLGVMLFPDDGISLDTDNENIWVHNNDIFYGTAGSDKDQAKGDGSCDVKGFSTYVTVSYNHFYDSGKCSLCGMSDSQEFFVTYHHNWYDHSDSRHPRIRVGTVHIYNNYFDGNAKYGVGITKGGSAFVEANYFRNCKYPMLISLQGSDVADGNIGTFSKEPGGMIKAYNNYIEGAKRLVYQTQDSTQFDAYLANSRYETVPSSYASVSGGNTYNNFDTSSAMYNYTPDDPASVEYKVTTYAGRVNGGDFSWTFTSEDDTDYSVNEELMAAIKGYQSDLVSIGGNSVVTTPDTDDDNNNTGDEDNNNTGNEDNEDNNNTGGEVTTGAATHNFTTDGLNSDVFTIDGNLSSSKGTVNYNGLELTTCLKIESSTSIIFNTAEASTLTLVFNSNFNKEIKIDGVKYQATNGILNVDLDAGYHIISKADSANLYYIALN